MNIEEVRELISVDDRAGCWAYGGYRRGKYLATIWDGIAQIGVHTFVYEHEVGPIPEGLHLTRVCRNLLCVNPEHMAQVTREEAVAALGYSRVEARECRKGHAYTFENTYFWNDRDGNPRRRCRTCQRAAQRAYDRKQSESRVYPEHSPDVASVKAWEESQKRAKEKAQERDEWWASRAEKLARERAAIQEMKAEGAPLAAQPTP